MIRHRVASLAVAMFVAGGAVALGAMSAGMSAPLATPPPFDRPPRISSPADNNSQVGIQMSMLDRHARFDMILFAGRLDRGDRQLAALALGRIAR